MFATVLDSAEIELMGKHANKTVHSDVYFHHSAGYCLKHFFIFFTSFYYSEFQGKARNAHTIYMLKHVYCRSFAYQLPNGTCMGSLTFRLNAVRLKDISSKYISSKRHIVEYDISSKTV